MYKVKYNGKILALSDKCSKELEKVCIGIAKNADGNWRNNHFSIYIVEGNGYIRTQIYGLSKVNRTNDIAISDLIKQENRDKYAFIGALYNMIVELNKCGIKPDELDIKFECGKIVDVEAIVWEDGGRYVENYGMCRVYFD